MDGGNGVDRGGILARSQRRRTQPARGAPDARSGQESKVTEPDIQLETVNVLLKDGAATIELNRPEALNAWNKQFGADLLTALRRTGEDEAIRAVRIIGAGRAFSSGADLKDISGDDLTPEGRPNVYKVLTERYHPIMHAIREMGKPVIAAVNGPAVGIGCSLALCCDLVLAAESAYLLLAFVNIGLVPDGGSSLFVPARVGVARAAEMAMLGERAERSSELAQRLAAGPTRAYAATKRQLNDRIYAGMEQQLELEAKLQQEMAGTDDFLEGVGAFLTKRPARFTGR